MYKTIQIVYRVIIILSMIILADDVLSGFLDRPSLFVYRGRLPAGTVIVGWFFSSLLLVPVYLVIEWVFMRNNKLTRRSLAIDIFLGVGWIIFFVAGFLISFGQGSIWLIR